MAYLFIYSEDTNDTRSIIFYIFIGVVSFSLSLRETFQAKSSMVNIDGVLDFI